MGEIDLAEVQDEEVKEWIAARGDGLQDDHRCALQEALIDFANVFEEKLSTPEATGEITSAFIPCVDAHCVDAGVRLAATLRDLDKNPTYTNEDDDPFDPENGLNYDEDDNMFEPDYAWNHEGDCSGDATEYV